MTRALLALVLVGFSAPGFGFELESTPVGVPLFLGDDFEYFIGGDDRALSLASRRAMDSWAAALGGGIMLVYGGPAELEPGRDGTNGVFLASRWDPSDGDAAITVGIAIRFFDVQTGVISEADILLNAETFAFDDTGVDLESALLHEAGHVLGLAHACGLVSGTYPSCFDIDAPPAVQRAITESVMAPTLALLESRRVLRSDDLAGLSALYDLGDVPRLTIEGTRLRCEDGALVIEGRGLPLGGGLTARYADGEHVELQVRERAVSRWVAVPPQRSGAFDLLIRGEAVGYRAVVEPSIARACPALPVVPPVLDAGGCDCNATHLPSFAMWPVVFGLFLLRRFRVGALLVAIVVLGAGDAMAYRCTRTLPSGGPSLIWPVRDITWVLSTPPPSLGPTVLVQVAASFDVWQAPTCSDLSFRFGGQFDGLVAGFGEPAERNVVVFVEEGWLHGEGVLAVTTSAFDPLTAIVFDTDIEVNAEHHDFVDADDGCVAASGEIDIRNTLVHEVGHLVGLAHPPQRPRFETTTMFASSFPCEVEKRDLDPDDLQGLCEIYPAGGATAQCFAPETQSFRVVSSDPGLGCKGVGRGAAAWWSTFALLFGAYFVARRKDQRRI